MIQATQPCTTTITVLNRLQAHSTKLNRLQEMLLTRKVTESLQWDPQQPR